MADEPIATPTAAPVVPAAPAAPVVASSPAPGAAVEPVAANPAPSLVTSAPAEPAAQTPEQLAAAETAKAESKARTDAFTAAADPAGKKAAYEALNADEKKATFDALSEDDRKALEIKDPTIPVYDFKLPEGMTVAKEQMDALTTLATETKTPPEVAQKFLDMHMSLVQAQANASVQNYVDTQNKWGTEVKADPEIGGPKLEATIASCARAIDRLNVPGFREALDLTGAGNHPAVVKAMNRIGQLMSEDRFKPGGNPPAAGPKSAAAVLYGDGPVTST